MAMFTQPQKDGRDSGGRSAQREAALSIVAAGTRILGEIDCDGVLKVEGTVVGTVRAERQVLVAKGGSIEGDVFTREAVVGGMIEGAILADDRVEVQANSTVNGDITTQRIVVQEGGEVNGRILMANPNALSHAAGHDADGAEPAVHRAAVG
jgi:cytoskeletal protein CcmA (bactofilin family)